MITMGGRTATDIRVGEFLDSFVKRVEAMPLGTCPIAVQLSLLQASSVQTCGKCTPCYAGIPRIEELLGRVLLYEATSADLAEIRRLAALLRDTADCAVGYNAGDVLLRGLEEFKEEYASHIESAACCDGVEQAIPCVTGCPAHVNVPGYISLVHEGDCAGAIGLIRKDNPFPTACALVCEHPCEHRCRRTIVDAPLNIRGIKKFAVDSVAADSVPTPECAAKTGRRVAVIGGGPSGLTCAYYLALMGHEVVVYEARKALGGMMRYGIPAYRFPRERLDEDIRAILSAGDIRVELEHRIDRAEMAKIFDEFDAVYVAIGAQGGKTLAVDGSDARGVESAVDLLGRIGDGDYPDFTGKNVAVIGGGNVAMDCARTAVRAGAKNVTVAYRRRLEDMTALPEEVEAAIAEGVEMMTLQSPVRIEKDEAGCARALVLQPQYIGAVKRGRPAPVTASKPEVSIDADIVLIAVGQDVQSASFEEFGMGVKGSYFLADEFLRSEGCEGVFVGGDCQTGPKTVIMAIAAGKVAARNIDDYLGFSHELDCGVTPPPARLNDRTAYGRVNIAERPARERKCDFECVEEPMSHEEAMQECGRCLRCDHYGVGALNGKGLGQW